MFDLIQVFGQGSEWIPVIVAFVALPGLYIVLAIDVHKDYAELVKLRITANRKFRLPQAMSLLKNIETKLYIFELDWWVVAATGVLLVAITSLGELVQFSSLAPACQLKPVVSCAPLCNSIADPYCVKMLSILRLYCVVVALLLSFRIGWARIAAAKDLRSLYATLGRKR